MIQRLITHGVSDVIDQKDLEKCLHGRKSLRVKFGADPTSPELHIGNAVPLWKLKEFQDLGHTVVLIIGDTTALVGDPSGRKKARPIMSERDVIKNSRTWIKQVAKVLDMDRVEIRKNSEWYNDMHFTDIITLASNMTVARIIERDDFSKRIRSGAEVYLHELLYPLMQAYDSVAVKADVEIGGTDQLFNLLAGRELQKKLGMRQQNIITLPLLVGTDGKEKMSKSVGNVIALSDRPSDMFGKIMAIPDTLIPQYALFASQWDEARVHGIKKRLRSENPRDIKADIAQSVVALYWSDRAAKKAREEFTQVFKERKLPARIPTIKIASGAQSLVSVLTKASLATSASDARRLISQGAVKINDKKYVDWKKPVNISSGTIIKVGKRRFIKIV